ncbi:hypothetical protein BC835DRAFT_1270809 [Cytidiella melzeri]|nr:hypothetical protein BC835DRAFT_1270809 [Cytidiella melzeri]
MEDSHPRQLLSFVGWYRPTVQRAWLYVRGPRPKIDLQDPPPFLNLTFHSGRRAYSLGLEPALVRATRHLQSPWFFAVFAAAYIVALAFLAREQAWLTPPEDYIGCTSVWWTQNAGCGLDGVDCTPFANASFSFRCPAQCASVTLHNPRTVGNERVNFVPLLVGGGDPEVTYRGDSFICAAAVQSGKISDSRGGCVTLSLVGSFTNYLPFTANGLTSLGFPSTFPLSFQFLPETDLTHCTDLRNDALIFNVLITVLLFWLLRPKPILTFWSLFCIGFWHVTLFSQPRANPPPIDAAFQTFLPALFVAYAFWRVAWRFTLPAFRLAPLESSVLYLSGFWVGVLANLTMDKIPIDRLTAADIRGREGAITALVIIILILLAIVINQVRVIRKTGWLPHYLAWYVAGGLVVLVISQLPGLELRIHHYIIAMVFMPGTAWPTRLSALYQGFLLGLFLNGVAAFGFDSILQTAADLQRDGPSGSALPAFLTNSTNFNTSLPLQNQTLFWNPISAAVSGDGYDGFALLVDDVLRYMGPATNYTLSALTVGIPHFFRLAYTSSGQAADFTMPATLWPNGTWVDPLPGAT